MELTAIVPVFNEESSVREVVEGLQHILGSADLSYEILVVDDGSTDRSGEILATLSGIRVIHHPYNLGYGAALKRGLRESQGEHIFIIDSDGSYPVEQLPSLLRFLERYDMVIGSRPSEKTPLLKRLAKVPLTLLASFVCGRSIPDLNSGMRVFRKDMAMIFFNMYPEGFSFTTTLTLAALTRGYSVRFVPIDFYQRKGKSSIVPRDFFGFLALIMRIATHFNPLKIFSAVGFSMLLLAVLVFLGSYMFLSKVMDITVILLALSGLLFFLFGMIADMRARNS